MTWINEENSDNVKAKKPCMLPTGEQAREIIKVLVEMYLTAYKPEGITNDDAKDEYASQ